MILKAILGAALAIVVLLGAIQLIPYGRNHVNPSVQAEPKWDSPQTRELAARACFDCHSNQTEWPWYSNVAPLSWLIQRDVEEGRRELNFSEWNRPQREAKESGKEVQKGSMPQWYYVLLHPSAGLSAQEKQTLIQGLNSITGR
jgi:hypothetical protein